MKLEPFLDGLSFGEGPRWHDGRLWYSDFYVHQVRRVDEAGRAETVVEVPGRPSGLGWRPDGHVYFDYDTNTNAIGGCGCTGDCFTASAYGNIDGDGGVSVVLYAHPDRNGVSCPSGVTGDVAPNDTDGNPIFDQPILSATSDDF